MTGLLAALRGLLHRAGISLNILLVAVVAVAAVSIGPAYYAAAQSSVVQDTVGTAPALGRGLEVAQSGSVDAVNGVAQQAQGLLAHYLGGMATLNRLFGPPVQAAETTVQASGQTVPLVYRTGVCAHLRFTSGHCPRAAARGGGEPVPGFSAALAHRPAHRGADLGTPGHHRPVPDHGDGCGHPVLVRGGEPLLSLRDVLRPQPARATRTTRCSPRWPRWASSPAPVQGTDYADFSLLPAHLTGPDVALVQTAVTGLTLNRELTGRGRDHHHVPAGHPGHRPGQLAGDPGPGGADHRAAAAAGLAAAVPDRRGRRRSPGPRGGAGQDARPRPVAVASRSPSASR